MSNKENPSDQNSSNRTQYSRRKVLRNSVVTSSAALTGGIGSTALVGSAAAAGPCSTTTGNVNPISYYDDWSGGKTETDINCTEAAVPNRKDIHGMSVLYSGTTYGGGDLMHHFHIVGHIEHYEQTTSPPDYSQCDEPWDHAYGVQGHRATVDSQQDFTWWDKPMGGSIGGHPKDYSGANVNLTIEQAAYTALTTAAGSIGGPWAGAAAGIALSLIPESQGDDTDTGDHLMFDWEYSNNNGPKCGTHAFDLDVQSNDPDMDSVDFDVVDEGWGMYPAYTKIEKQVSFLNDIRTNNIKSPRRTSSYSGSTPNKEYWLSTDHPSPPSKGEVIETTKGEKVRVTDVSVSESITIPDAKKRTMRAKDLPNGIDARYDENELVEFSAEPAIVRDISLSGERIE